MKKRISLALALALALGLTACSADGDSTRSTSSPSPVVGSPAAGIEAPFASETVTITPLNVDKEAVELEVSYDPQRIATLDMISLDVLDTLGVAGDHVVGSADASLDCLQSYVTDENAANLGTIKTADLEMVMTAQPGVIFIGGRLAKSYDALSKIAPVVYLATDSELGVVESVRQDTVAIVSMFSLEDKVNELMAGFDARIQALADFATDKTAIMGVCTSGDFNVLGNDDRCSTIGREIGFENIGVGADIDASTHGSEVSFEFVVKKSPDYVFVMDWGAAIQIDGAQFAQEIMEGGLVIGTDACKNGNIVYLAYPAVWYATEGGITAPGIMLQDPENKLLG